MTGGEPHGGRQSADWAARVAALPPAKRALLDELIRRRAAARTSPADPLAVVELLRAGKASAGDPVVVAHPIGGSLFCYASLCQAIRPGRAIWGVAAGSALAAPAEFTMEQLARRYVAGLDEVGVPIPAVVAGWSFGGLLAYEMARQWHASGRAVPPVLLIDAVPWPHSLRAWSQQTTLRSFAEYLLELADQHPDLPSDPAIWRLPVPEALDAAARAVREHGAELGFSGPELVRRYWMFANAAQAMSRYRPGPYLGPVTLIRTAQSAAENRTEAGTEASPWPPSTAAALTVLSVPGDHYAVLRPPVVDIVAQVLTAAADAVTAG